MAQEKHHQESSSTVGPSSKQSSSTSSSSTSKNSSTSRRLPKCSLGLLKSGEKLSSLRNYLHSSKGDLKSGGSEQHEAISRKGPEKCKSMMTLNSSSQQGQSSSTSLFSFPSQLRLVEKISQHREWMAARFCSNQSAASSLLQQATRQPLAIWSRSASSTSKIVVNGTAAASGHNQLMNTSSSAANGRTDAVDLLLQLKGANWRHRQLQYQMPIHDAELLRQPTAESRFIRGKQRRALVRSELFLAPTTPLPQLTCHRCKQFISSAACVKISLHDWLNGQKNGVSNGNNNNSSSTTTNAHHFFHIDCFKCEECQEVLVDLKAYLHPTSTANTDHHHQHHQPQQLVSNSINNNPNELQYSLFCCRHFVEIYKPRCPHCDRLILDEECTEAEGKAWHIGHFCCTECSRSLGGQQYIMASADVVRKDNVSGGGLSNSNRQLPYCLTCFDINFGELCEECGELIGCEVGAIIHEGRSWHATDSCFRCSLCLKSLLGKPFLPAMDGRIYCSLTCSQAMISHQREKARRTNRLHGLQQHASSQKKKNGVVLAIKPETPKMELVMQSQSSSAAITTNGNSSDQGKNAEFNSLTESASLKKSSPSNTIKENRDQFLKSMTLSRYEQKVKANQNRTVNSQNSQEIGDYCSTKLKALNLSQLVNYEQFIKQNNQYFTTKYDWSKEQEFVETAAPSVNTDDNSTHGSINEQVMSSSLTTATLSDADGGQSEDSSNHQAPVLPSQRDIHNSQQPTSSECSNSLERSSPAYFTGISDFHKHQHLLRESPHLYSTLNHPTSSSQTVATSSSPHTILPPPRFSLSHQLRTSDTRKPLQQPLHFTAKTATTLQSNPFPATPSNTPNHHYYNLKSEKSCCNSPLLNSPSNSSNETPPSWTAGPMSPPPEYSKLVEDHFKDGGESSSLSSSTGHNPLSLTKDQQLQSKVKSSNGILKSRNSNSKTSPPLMEETLLVRKLLLSKAAALEQMSSLEASPSPATTSANNSDSDTSFRRQTSSVDTSNNSPQQHPTFFQHNHHLQYQTSTPINGHQQQQEMVQQQNKVNHQQQQQYNQQRPTAASGSSSAKIGIENNHSINKISSSRKQSAAASTKSVSFDPNIEDKDESKRRYIRRLRSRESEELLSSIRGQHQHEDCSDSHSCSSCSTCSSSSSDDDEDGDFDLVNYRADRQQNAANATTTGQTTSNDACIIS